MSYAVKHSHCPAHDQCTCAESLRRELFECVERCEVAVGVVKAAHKSAYESARKQKRGSRITDYISPHGEQYRTYLDGILVLLQGFALDSRNQSGDSERRALWRKFAEDLKPYQKDAEDKDKFISFTETPMNDEAREMKEAIVGLAENVYRLLPRLDVTGNSPGYLKHIEVSHATSQHPEGEYPDVVPSRASSYLMTSCNECYGWTFRTETKEDGIVDAVLHDRFIAMSVSATSQTLENASSASAAPLTYVGVSLKPADEEPDGFSARGMARRGDETRDGMDHEETRTFLTPGDSNSDVLTRFTQCCEAWIDALNGAAWRYGTDTVQGGKLLGAGRKLTDVADACRRADVDSEESEEE